MRYYFESFFYSLQGVKSFFSTEKNGKLQGAISVIVLLTGWWLKITRMEWLFILGCIGIVVALEMINSSLERICNMYTREKHPDIKFIKDVSAAAVLWACVFAGITGVVIFYPYLKTIFN